MGIIKMTARMPVSFIVNPERPFQRTFNVGHVTPSGLDEQETISFFISSSNSQKWGGGWQILNYSIIGEKQFNLQVLSSASAMTCIVSKAENKHW